MSLETDVKALLAANGTLSASWVIIVYDDTGRNGLTYQSYPAAYDATTRRMKKVILIRQRSKYPNGQIVDEGTQQMSVTAALEIQFFQDGVLGFGALESAETVVRGILNFRYADRKMMRLRDSMWNKRITELDNAATLTAVYDCVGVEP